MRARLGCRSDCPRQGLSLARRSRRPRRAGSGGITSAAPMPTGEAGGGLWSQATGGRALGRAHDISPHLATGAAPEPRRRLRRRRLSPATIRPVASLQPLLPLDRDPPIGIDCGRRRSGLRLGVAATAPTTAAALTDPAAPSLPPTPAFPPALPAGRPRLARLPGREFGAPPVLSVGGTSDGLAGAGAGGPLAGGAGSRGGGGRGALRGGVAAAAGALGRESRRRRRASAWGGGSGPCADPPAGPVGR